ncbi:putative RDD family membrane protein YckC [Kitasatospora sp. MAA19]|uniref:RDD family protein n=1 Tax=Kitasatospora sp. MAA19 TaxID=3035090 RepID=UPI002475C4AD|nr:RDD family protein [Kitasatospora sp. MAA19]MDH6711071.1 putative RDD family membrane protein YckC [Kitasatospora sp. MAA19]
MSDLVTGEAVVLDLQTAKLPSRALAIALDLLVEFAALLLVSLLLSVALIGLDGAALAATLLGLLVFFLVAVPVMVETLSHGRSLGKAALGLRVVRTDGGPVRFRHSLVRGLVGFMELVALTGVPAVITSAVNVDGRRLGDIFAGTVVVRERTPGGGTASPLPPVHPHLLQAMGRELVAMDLSAVPESLWLAVRQLLGRIGQLDPAVALRMSARLADDLAARTGHPVAPGLHPAAYLGAVLTERQRREWMRAQAQQRMTAPAAPAPARQAPAPQPPTADGRPLRVLGVPAATTPTTPAPAPAAPSFEKPAPAPGTGFAPPA